MASDLLYLAEAQKHVGQKEVPGPKSNPWIAQMWAALPGGKWFWTNYGSDDSRLAWCGGFVAYCLQVTGYPIVKSYASARAWAAYGVGLTKPCHGCIVVFSRDGGGHVGFVVGFAEDGRLLVLGGNQGDAVNIRAFDPSRVLAYRMPAGARQEPVKTLAWAGESSRNEA